MDAQRVGETRIRCHRTCGFNSASRTSSGVYFSDLALTPKWSVSPPAPVTVSSVDGTIYLEDPELRGQVNSWPSEQIQSISAGGLLCHILRVGHLRLRPRSGESVTLLCGYRVRDLKRIRGQLTSDTDAAITQQSPAQP